METLETLDFILLVFKQFFKGLLDIVIGPFIGIGEQFDFAYYIPLVQKYIATNGGFAWFVVILVSLVMLAIVGGFAFLIFLLVKKFIKIIVSII